MYVCTFINAHKHVNMLAHVCMYACVYVCMRAYVCVFMYVCMYVRMYVCIHTHTQTSTCKHLQICAEYMHIYVHARTHTRTRTHQNPPRLQINVHSLIKKNNKLRSVDAHTRTYIHIHTWERPNRTVRK